MRLIVGLGNPGRRYARTRHNAGFMAVDRLACSLGVQVRRRREGALVGEGSLEGEPVVLGKPQTFMNLSGQAVAALVARYQVPLSHLLVIHDDLDLPLGRLRLRGRGSSGGHLGVESVITELRTDSFCRLKIGIGRPGPEEDVVSYVLSPFRRAERPLVEAVLGEVPEAVRVWATRDLEAATNYINSLDRRGEARGR
ncbi:MAG: aminoacyl-tRNA hydrolase [Clostridia bacterium]|nr:MAG: aminoacyl-tRNA hydrolase [Clostridia bacterium]